MHRNELELRCIVANGAYRLIDQFQDFDYEYADKEEPLSAADFTVLKV
jgi:hypothetical protein